MPRNQEVIRQWRLLHALESSRHGATIDGLASDLDVTTRTIRRDLAALQEAGIALYDERDDDGRVRWRIERTCVWLATVTVWAGAHRGTDSGRRLIAFGRAGDPGVTGVNPRER